MLSTSRRFLIAITPYCDQNWQEEKAKTRKQNRFKEHGERSLDTPAA